MGLINNFCSEILYFYVWTFDCKARVFNSTKEYQKSGDGIVNKKSPHSLKKAGDKAIEFWFSRLN